MARGRKKLTKYEKPITIKDTNPSSFANEMSFANSPLYDKYTLRPYNPAELYQKHGNYDLYDKMREDDQISAILSLKKIITLNSEWEIESENEEIEEFIEWALQNCLDDVFSKKIYEILSAWDYGFSVTEIIGGVEDDYEGSPKYVIKALKTRAPHSIEFHQDEYGNVIKIIQSRSMGSDIELKPEKFIVYTYQKEFDNPYGNSDLNKGVYRAWWSKEAIIKFWNIYLERFGSPTPVVTIPRSAGSVEKNRIKEILQNWQAKTGITMPEEFKIELLNVGSSAQGGGFEKAIDKYNTMIARRMLVPDLMGFSGGETSGGSFALGEKHFEIFNTIIGYLRQDIENVITRNIIDKLVMWNFGAKEKAYFKFRPVDAARKAENVKMWIEAVKTGKVPVTPDQINWVLGSVEAPEISEEELAKIEEEKKEMQEAISGQGNNAEGDNGNNDPVQSSDGKNKQNAAGNDTPDGGNGKDQQYEFKPERALTTFEKKINFQKLNNSWDGLDDKYIKSVTNIFQLMINGLIDDVKKKNIVGKKKIEAIKNLKFRNVGVLVSEYKKMFRETAVMSDENVPTQYTINTSTGLDNEDIAKWFGEQAFNVAGIDTEKVLNDIQNVLMQAIRNGWGVDKAIKEIELVVAGYTAPAPYRIETVVRTNISTAFNEYRAQWYEKQGDAIQGFFFSAILDGRTSAICRSLVSELNGDENGPKIYKAGELRTINPPRHHNCRSVLVPVYIDETVNNWADKLPENMGF